METQTRIRKSSPKARQEALAAARELLLEGGSSAVTLTAVGERVGRSHSNMIHHFGSIAQLQGELMDMMVRELAEQVSEALERITPGSETGYRQAIDIVFDAFDGGGAAQLATWLVLAQETQRGESFAAVVRDLADHVARLRDGSENARERARKIITVVAYMAYADAMIGPALAPMLGVRAGAARDLAYKAALAAVG